MKDCMKKLSFCFLFICLVVSPISARDTVSLHLDTFVNKIHLRHQGDSIRFTPELRPLIQVPGGRRPFYAYLWDFGDGHFSTEPEPVHRYKEPGDYEVSLYAVNNYDDGPRPKRTKRPVAFKPNSGHRITSIAPNSSTSCARPAPRRDV